VRVRHGEDQPAFTIGPYSIGRARSLPARCVASMHTPTFSMMSQMRSTLLCLLMSLPARVERQSGASSDNSSLVSCAGTNSGPLAFQAEMI
jgi:hypothetical protein